jgi:hypothetical protein
MKNFCWHCFSLTISIYVLRIKRIWRKFEILWRKLDLSLLKTRVYLKYYMGTVEFKYFMFLLLILLFTLFLMIGEGVL